MVLGSTLTFKVSTIDHSVIYPPALHYSNSLIKYSDVIGNSLGPRRIERP